MEKNNTTPRAPSNDGALADHRVKHGHTESPKGGRGVVGVIQW